MSTSNTHEHLTPEQALEVGYERTEPNAIKVALTTAIIVFTIVGSCYAVYYWYIGQLEYTRHAEFEVPIWQDLKDVRSSEVERLTQYKYIDKGKGSVQLPIERSMELLIQEANAGKTFYKGANEGVKPREIDPNLQTVIDKALGKTPAAVAPPAAAATPGVAVPGAANPAATAPAAATPSTPAATAPAATAPKHDASKH